MLGIICAMEIELNGLVSLMDDKSEVIKANKFRFTFGKIRGKNIVVALCGIGKANAAAVTALMIEQGATEIINLGVCGGEKAGQLIVATSVVQYDFDLTAFGEELGKLDSFDSPYIACTLALQGKIPAVKGVIASGDKFVADDQTKRFLVDRFSAVGFDMESGAVAQICTEANVPFAILRVVSDGGDVSEYEKFKVEAASKGIAAVLVHIDPQP